MALQSHGKVQIENQFFEALAIQLKISLTFMNRIVFTLYLEAPKRQSQNVKSEFL